MDIIVLGSGTGTPSVRRSPSSLTVKAGGLRVLIDSGSGTLRRLAEANIPVQSIHHIFYTHFHPDHTADLGPILFALKYTVIPERTDPMGLWGPAGFNAFFDFLHKAWGHWIIPSTFDLALEDLPLNGPQQVKLGDVLIESHPVQHKDPSLGYRIEHGGKVLAVSGDSEYCKGLVEAAQGADLFVCECSRPDDMKTPGHMGPTEAGRTAREAGAKRLLLTHFYPECDAADVLTPCRKEFPGEVILAEDLMHLKI
ncbi:MAG: MBL fold metallo-hydrolase [Deltaproteobacteria bacterium]|nr:MBL fold metallo-hydrolase [Deltaproteobacteria bacterium]MBW2306367.1 MBL fold metallo-hydrolase [Deltaproteobacteria bacterium]